MAWGDKDANLLKEGTGLVNMMSLSFFPLDVGHDDDGRNRIRRRLKNLL